MAICRYGSLGWFDQMVGSEDQMRRYLVLCYNRRAMNGSSFGISRKFLAGAQIQAAIRLHCKRDDQKGGDFLPANAVFKQTPYCVCLENFREENAQQGASCSRIREDCQTEGVGATRTCPFFDCAHDTYKHLTASASEF